MKKIQVNLRGTVFLSRSPILQKTLETLTSKNEAEILADGSYFLDRNPLIFHHILDHFSHGQFHLPRNICPIHARRELEFWAVPLAEVPQCCYQTLYDDNESENRAISALEGDEDREEERYNVNRDRYRTAEACSWTVIRYKLIQALNSPLHSVLGKVWLFVVAVFTALSITVFLLESSALFRDQRPGQPSNTTIELFGHNPKLLKLATTIMSPEMAFMEILSNTVLMLDLILRFSISRKKKQFFRKPYNILELLIEIIIFTFTTLELLLPPPESTNENISYALSLFLQILYSLRVFRIFRVLDSCSEMKMLKLSLLKSKTEFLLFVTVLISFAFIFGSWIYWAEFLNPETFPNIFVGIWWAVVTMTTVGYGDFAPKSTAGYLVGVLTSIFGLILLAMPIATIASNFSKIYDCYNFRKTHLNAKRSKEIKPHLYQKKETSLLYP